MADRLLLSVRFYDGRYHGSGDWPPSPARLFQALVAGAARGAILPEEARLALTWLEGLEPPVIAAPRAKAGRAVTSYVPNNDLDAVGGDPRKVAAIRAGKVARPRLFASGASLMYLWSFEGSQSEQAAAVIGLAAGIYQFGRGVDPAWATGRLLSDAEAERLLADYQGVVHRPSEADDGLTLLCPGSGSLLSLEARFSAQRRRFIRDPLTREVVFVQLPKASFRPVGYGGVPRRLLFEIRAADASADFWSVKATAAPSLTIRLRDAAAQRLKASQPDAAALVDRVLIGLGADAGDKALRVRIVPLPSIGHRHADEAIRRVLLEVPQDCPLSPADLRWAFSGLEAAVSEEGEILAVLAPPAMEDRSAFAGHFGIETSPTRTWRTVTPAALPVARRRGRIDGRTRRTSEAEITWAVRQALRHAGVTTPVETIRIQREPFSLRGDRAESFALPGRFEADRLHHAEVTFERPVRGPLIIGDGRWLGLGVMAPVAGRARDVFFFPMPPGSAVQANQATLLSAFRRALMALARDHGCLTKLFSGHEENGDKASGGHHRHLFLSAIPDDGAITGVLVAAPWRCDRNVRSTWRERQDLDRVVSSLRTLRAGPLGLFQFTSPVEAIDSRLLGPATCWESFTAYHPTRHAATGSCLAEFIERDLLEECRRRDLPRPRVEVIDWISGPRGGNISARLRLTFDVAIDGPLMLGKDSHRSGGLFGTKKCAEA